MRITVKFFAALREAAGRSEIERDLPEGATVERLLADVQASLPAVGPGLAQAHVAVNRRYAAVDTALHDGDEVAIFPPVSGG